jgi:hypothetical protein
LILALYRSGRQVDALATAGELRRKLGDELGLDPSPESQRFERLILRQDRSLNGLTAPPSPSSPGSVGPAPNESVVPDAVLGRAGELDAIVAAVDAARHGTGRLLVVEGPAGMGKSTVLGRLESTMRAIGGIVLTGSGVSTGATPALWPWITVLRQLREIEPAETDAMLDTPATQILSLLDPGSGVAAPESELIDAVLARTRLYRRLIDLLKATRQKHPLAIIFDDAHWLDTDSVNLLTLAARELTGHGVIFAVVLRPDEVPAVSRIISTLSAAMGAGTLRLSLAGLAPAEVGRVVARLSGGDSTRELVWRDDLGAGPVAGWGTRASNR